MAITLKPIIYGLVFFFIQFEFRISNYNPIINCKHVVYVLQAIRNCWWLECTVIISILCRWYRNNRTFSQFYTFSNPIFFCRLFLVVCVDSNAVCQEGGYCKNTHLIHFCRQIQNDSWHGHIIWNRCVFERKKNFCFQMNTVNEIEITPICHTNWHDKPRNKSSNTLYAFSWWKRSSHSEWKTLQQIILREREQA